MNRHPSQTLIERFARHQASGDEVLEVDRHLEICPTCRARVRSEITARQPERSQGPSDHLDFETLRALLVANDDGSELVAARLHLDRCARCREDLDDLRGFVSEWSRSTESASARRPALLGVPPSPRRLADRPWGLLAVAAALLLVLGASVWWLSQGLDRSGPSRLAAGDNGPGTTGLPSRIAERLDRVLAGAPLEIPAELDSVLSRGSVLLGTPEELAGRPAETPQPLSPLGTFVADLRPEFRWRPVPGATGYRVELFDLDFDGVARSPILAEPRFTPVVDLPRDRVLLWQVSAQTPEGELRAPEPPSPEARFRIVDAAAAERVEQARQGLAGRPLELAIVLAGEGLVQESRRLLEPLSVSEPDSRAAELLSQLDRRLSLEDGSNVP